jgi:hypothetical protein
MIDRPDHNHIPADQPEPQPRRQWHTPQFVVMDLSATHVVSNAGTDGGPMHSLS